METRTLDETSTRRLEDEEEHLTRTAAEWEVAWAARRIARLGRYGTGEGQPLESGWARDTTD